MDIDIQEIIGIARLAGKKVMDYYASTYDYHFKSHGAPVTQADLASDEIIRQSLEKFGVPILTEESRDFPERLDSQYLWIVDPLDGTNDFIKKDGEFSVLIGLVENGSPILGVVLEPCTGNIFFAENEKGAYRESEGKIEKLRVSVETETEKMKIFFSRSHLLEKELQLADNLNLKEKITLGSAGLKIARIAEGKGEIYVNSSNRTGEWDTCAPEVILKEAGGMITSGKGEPLPYNKKIPLHPDGFIVTNGRAHQGILAAYNEISTT